MSNIEVPVVLLEKVAQFIELASSENEALRSELATAKTKTASTEEVKVEVAKVPEAFAKVAAEALVKNGLTDSKYLAEKIAELQDPAKMSDNLTKLASLYAQKGASTLGSAEKTASRNVQSNPLQEARNRFAANIGAK